MLLSYNPLMSIALTAEILTEIGNAKKSLMDETNEKKEAVLSLGQYYTDKIPEEDYYEELVMNTDFNGRTVLKIICDCELMPLLDQSNAMAEALIIKMWDGYESPNCDGNIYGFSNMMHILVSKGTKSTKDTTYSEICMKQF